MIIKLCTLDSATRRKDRSISMRFTTCVEQTSEEFKILDMLHQSHVMVAIKPEDTPFLDAEIKDLDSVDMDLIDAGKSQSTRIRSLLWLNCEKELERAPTKDEFKDYYQTKTENIITYLKNKLD